MKPLKTLLTLAVAMAVSTPSFAETSVLSNAKEMATSSLKSTKEVVVLTDQMNTAKETLNAANAQINSAKDTLNTNSKDRVQNSVSEKISNAKLSASEKVKNVKTTANEKADKVKSAVSEKASNVKSAAKINVNKADSKTLQSLSGIGESKAQAIIDYRNKVGKIKNAKELSNISGIGEATLEKIAPYLSF